MTFSGNAKVTFGDAFDFGAASPISIFSLEAWVKPTTVDATSRRVFSKEITSGGEQGYYLINTTAKLQFARLRDGVLPGGQRPGPAANQTKHVVVTYDGSTMGLYVNGALVASDPSTQALLDTTAQFTVGAKASGGGNGRAPSTSPPSTTRCSRRRRSAPTTRRVSRRPAAAVGHDAAGEARDADRDPRRRLCADQPLAGQHRDRISRVVHAPAQAHLPAGDELRQRPHRILTGRRPTSRSPMGPPTTSA